MGKEIDFDDVRITIVFMKKNPDFRYYWDWINGEHLARYYKNRSKIIHLLKANFILYCRYKLI